MADIMIKQYELNAGREIVLKTTVVIAKAFKMFGCPQPTDEAIEADACDCAEIMAKHRIEANDAEK